MISLRPGTKVKLWAPKFSNRPDVEPPALLKFAGAISIFSAAGTLIYAVAVSLALGGSAEDTGVEAIYVAMLHFVLPVAVFYTINVNSPLSRFAIAFYVATLCVATIAGKGFLGNLPVSELARIAPSMAIMVLVFYWLFGSAKMRLYYAVISNRPIPGDLVSRVEDLRGGTELSPRVRTMLEWTIDRLETAVLLGFIAVVIYAYWSTG